MSSRGNLEDEDHLLGARSNGGCDEALVENVDIHQPQVTASGSTPGDIEMQHQEVTLSSENSQAQDSPAGQFMRSMGRRRRAIDLLPRCPNGPVGDIDKKMLEAAMLGDVQLLRITCRRNPESLFQTTPQGNSCLHIAAIHGQLMFFLSAWRLQKPLVLAVNSNGQTALMVAVIHGFPSIVTHTISLLRGQLVLAEALLVADDAGYNVLHHAIRCGYQDLALELIVEAPELSKGKSIMSESPMYIATLKNYKEIFEQLISISDSADCGQYGNNALHAAVLNGNEDIVKTIMEHRPSMAKIENSVGTSPVRLSVNNCRTEVLRVFLKMDFLLGYEISDAGQPLLVSAACHGAIDVAKELLLYCPDAPYKDSTTGVTCLHEAIISEHEEFLNFIISAPQLRALVNLRDDSGKTALHLAVQKCRPKLVESILSHKDVDISILDDEGHSAAWELRYAYSEAKTLEWNEICMLLSKADPRDSFSIHFLQKEARINAVNASRLDSKALSKTYTSNTAIIATLIATITFAASFTVPGGYSSDPGSAGQPVFSRSLALIAFLIFNALAMFSSFLVAFLCVLYRWGDYRFLVHYKAVTKLLMWVAYVSTIVAFITGMYTFLAPDHLWLAILILCCGALVPLATKLVGEWPVLMLMMRSRLGRGPSTYRGQLLDIV